MIWPLWRFWTFTPLQWIVALAWNISEWLHFPLPYAPEAFGIIIGAKPKKCE